MFTVHISVHSQKVKGTRRTTSLKTVFVLLSGNVQQKSFFTEYFRFLFVFLTAEM